LHILENATGAEREIGHHRGKVTGSQMVLIGPGLQHGWQHQDCRSTGITETTLHIHAHLFSDKFLQRNQMKGIKLLLTNAGRGVCFPGETIAAIVPLLHSLRATTTGFESFLVLMRILDILSQAPATVLSSPGTRPSVLHFPDNRMERVLDYVNQHFNDPITLKEAAGMAGMTAVSFSRYFKQRTGRTFMECLKEIRIGYASRMLAETTNSIAEIAFSSGFHNISNFNRIFRLLKNLTPKQYREVFSAERVYKMCS
jgi:AraC-like DNA-binding protein